MKKSAILTDKIGICISIICMAHCLAIPLFLLFGFDATLRFIDQEWIEWLIVALALIIGVISFLGGFIVHKQHYILVLFASGFLLLLNGESISQPWISILISIIGALIISYAHLENLKWKAAHKSSLNLKK